MSVHAGEVRVGERLRARRAERGLTITDVAERTDLTDDVPGGKLIRRDEQARRSLALGNADHLLLSGGDERRFHVTESHIPPGGSAGDELYTLPADVEHVYVL